MRRPLLLSGVVLGLIGAWAYHVHAIHAIRAELHSRPPVAVVRLADYVATLSPNASQERLGEVLAAYDSAVGRLVEAGYLVLDGEAVAGAPGDLFVTVDLALKTAESPGDDDDPVPGKGE